MLSKIKAFAAWLGILVGYCPIAGTAFAINSGGQRPVLAGALVIGFVAVNAVGLVFGLRRNKEVARDTVKAGFGYGLMVGAVVAGAIWFFAP